MKTMCEVYQSVNSDKTPLLFLMGFGFYLQAINVFLARKNRFNSTPWMSEIIYLNKKHVNQIHICNTFCEVPSRFWRKSSFGARKVEKLKSENLHFHLGVFEYN